MPRKLRGILAAGRLQVDGLEQLIRSVDGLAPTRTAKTSKNTGPLQVEPEEQVVQHR